jgi:hypothetical protein
MYIRECGAQHDPPEYLATAGNATGGGRARAGTWMAVVLSEAQSTAGAAIARLYLHPRALPLLGDSAVGGPGFRSLARVGWLRGHRSAIPGGGGSDPPGEPCPIMLGGWVGPPRGINLRGFSHFT